MINDSIRAYSGSGSCPGCTPGLPPGYPMFILGPPDIYEDYVTIENDSAEEIWMPIRTILQTLEPVAVESYNPDGGGPRPPTAYWEYSLANNDGTDSADDVLDPGERIARKWQIYDDGGAFFTFWVDAYAQSERTFHSDSEYQSILQLDNNTLLLAYRDNANSGKGTFQILDQDGNVVRAATVFHNASTKYITTTLLNNGNACLAFTGPSDAGYLAILDEDGNVVKSPTQFDAHSLVYTAAATFSGGRIWVSYVDKSGWDALKGIIFHENGNVAISSFTIYTKDHDTYNYMSAEAIQNNKVVILSRGRSNGQDGYYEIWNSLGQRTYSGVQIPHNAHNTLTALNNGNCVVVGSFDSNPHYRIIDESGTIVRPQSSFGAGLSYYPAAVTLDNGNFLVALDGSSSKVIIAHDQDGNELSRYEFTTETPRWLTMSRQLANGKVALAYNTPDGTGKYIFYEP